MFFLPLFHLFLKLAKRSRGWIGIFLRDVLIWLVSSLNTKKWLINLAWKPILLALVKLMLWSLQWNKLWLFSHEDPWVIPRVRVEGVSDVRTLDLIAFFLLRLSCVFSSRLLSDAQQVLVFQMSFVNLYAELWISLLYQRESCANVKRSVRLDCGHYIILLLWRLELRYALTWRFGLCVFYVNQVLFFSLSVRK